MSLVHGVSTATKHDKWSDKSEKRDWPLLVTLLRVQKPICVIVPQILIRLTAGDDVSDSHMLHDEYSPESTHIQTFFYYYIHEYT